MKDTQASRALVGSSVFIYLSDSLRRAQAATIMTMAMQFFLRVGEWIMIDFEEISFVKGASSHREFLYLLFVLSKGDKNGDGVFRCATHRPFCPGCFDEPRVVLTPKLTFSAAHMCTPCMLSFHLRRMQFVESTNMCGGPVFRNPSRLDRAVPYGFLASLLQSRLEALNETLEELEHDRLSFVAIKDSGLRRTAATHAVVHADLRIDVAMQQGRWKFLKTLELYLERAQAIQNAAAILCALGFVVLGSSAVDTALSEEEQEKKAKSTTRQSEADFDLSRKLDPSEGLPFAKELSDVSVQAQLGFHRDSSTTQSAPVD